VDPVSLLLALAPFLAPLLVLGTVMIVAVVRARPEDIPAMLSSFVEALCRLADRLPCLNRPRRQTEQTMVDGEEGRR
jgi:hypothetical protein